MTEITCTLCGFSFDASAQRSCAACPLQNGCQLACCPNCGFEVVDPNQSVLARAVARLFRRPAQEQAAVCGMNIASHAQAPSNLAEPRPSSAQRLTELPPGSSARILDFAPDLPADRKAQLQAYGLIPGNALWVRQHKPVTVIQVDHTELAFEFELANSIYLEKL